MQEGFIAPDLETPATYAYPTAIGCDNCHEPEEHVAWIRHPHLHLPNDAEWGKYLVPSEMRLEQRARMRDRAESSSAMRVAQFGSYFRGLHVGLALVHMEYGDPDALEMVGIATDGIAEKDARVTAKRRVWQYIDADRRRYYQELIEMLGADHGLPVYTGKVKSAFFHEQVLPQWSPDVIVQSTFGQLIDRPIFSFPDCGMYNCHPSHLAEGEFPGGNPFNEMLDAGKKTTRMTIHDVDEGFDTGNVVGFSPEINIQPMSPNVDRGEHIQQLHEKTGEVAAFMSKILVSRIGETGTRLQTHDFQQYFSRRHREYLLQPICL